MSQDEYERNQEWYCNALEALQPLRYHIDELIQQIEQHNRIAARLRQSITPTGISPIAERQLTPAKQAQATAEQFFTNPNPETNKHTTWTHTIRTIQKLTKLTPGQIATRLQLGNYLTTEEIQQIYATLSQKLTHQ